jgi:hypothetical protein
LYRRGHRRTFNALPAGEREPLAGPYGTTKALLEYDATNWRAAADQARLAVKYAPGRESRLVQALAIAALPDHEVPLRQAASCLQPVSEPGPAQVPGGGTGREPVAARWIASPPTPNERPPPCQATTVASLPAPCRCFCSPRPC